MHELAETSPVNADFHMLEVYVFAPTADEMALGLTPDGRPWGSWRVALPPNAKSSAERLGKWPLGMLRWFQKPIPVDEALQPELPLVGGA